MSTELICINHPFVSCLSNHSWNELFSHGSITSLFSLCLQNNCIIIHKEDWRILLMETTHKIVQYILLLTSHHNMCQPLHFIAKKYDITLNITAVLTVTPQCPGNTYCAVTEHYMIMEQAGWNISRLVWHRGECSHLTLLQPQKKESLGRRWTKSRHGHCSKQNLRAGEFDFYGK